MDFYLGTHQVDWLEKTEAKLFISRSRLKTRKMFPRAKGLWALDSGGFTQLNKNGRWDLSASDYANEVRVYRDKIGNLEWAAIQDWMCEPFVLEKTGKTISDHQRLTTENYLELRRIAPDIPWAPVIQGWESQDYQDHIDHYARNGVRLSSLPTVGVGSICRRQATAAAAEILAAIHSRGIKIHGFGLKMQGLAVASRFLKSSDSLAWSFCARYTPVRLEGCPHRTCANCFRYAMKWRSKVMKIVADQTPETPAPKRGRPRSIPLASCPEIERIRLARASDPRTDREIAESAGIAPASMSRVLSGSIDPSLSTIRAILKSLNLPWSTFDGA